MCLGVPGKIIKIKDLVGMPIAEVDFGGVVKEAGLTMLPEAKVGDYVIVHAGFAIRLLEEKEALETIKLLEDMSGQSYYQES